jgi:hypothetical protein
MVKRDGDDHGLLGLRILSSLGIGSPSAILIFPVRDERLLTDLEACDYPRIRNWLLKA